MIQSVAKVALVLLERTENDLNMLSIFFVLLERTENYLNMLSIFVVMLFLNLNLN